MSNATSITAADLYTRIADAFVGDPAFEQALLADFDGAVAGRFGVKLPKPAKLVRLGSGFRLSYDGQDYDLGDPRTATKGELNDAELELVSAGGGECPQAPGEAAVSADYARIYGKDS
jgi:hypothetical protein